jgi:predicted nucleic acid-binding protein
MGSGRFAWAVSTEILLEYEEIMTRLGSPAYAAQALRTVSMIGSLRPGSLMEVTPSFSFRTISADHDDDKFADCAIAANADIIITSDHHFQALIDSGYKPQPITPEEFIRRYLIV